jgi:hypothetical protein
MGEFQACASYRFACPTLQRGDSAPQEFGGIRARYPTCAGGGTRPSRDDGWYDSGDRAVPDGRDRLSAAGHIRDSATCGPAPKRNPVAASSPDEILRASGRKATTLSRARSPADGRPTAGEPRSPASPIGAPNVRSLLPALSAPPQLRGVRMPRRSLSSAAREAGGDPAGTQRPAGKPSATPTADPLGAGPRPRHHVKRSRAQPRAPARRPNPPRSTRSLTAL